MIVAIPMTTRRFGPSGSSKKKNIALERVTATIARRTRGIFFELRGIFIII
jgi:hypothetical protein